MHMRLGGGVPAQYGSWRFVDVLTDLVFAIYHRMGAGIVPKVLDLNLLDEVVPIHSDQAMEMTRNLWMIGLPVGVSAGAIVSAAVQVCGRPESADKVAVAIIPSFGERYFTHPMFAEIKTKAEGLTKQPLPENSQPLYPLKPNSSHEEFAQACFSQGHNFV